MSCRTTLILDRSMVIFPPLVRGSPLGYRAHLQRTGMTVAPDSAALVRSSRQNNEFLTSLTPGDTSWAYVGRIRGEEENI